MAHHQGGNAVAIGVAYFGSRILRHVAEDMADLARLGFTGVLHTFSENDLYYYRQQLARIVAASHEAGLEVQLGPWGVGFAFGGEAESRFTAVHPELTQVLDDGRPVGAGCLNQPAFRDFVRSWADAALEIGADRIFWDEPHWANPGHFDMGEKRWACICPACRERFRATYGESMPRQLAPEVTAFREASLIDFIHDLVSHVHRQGGRSTVCLLPRESRQGLADWEAVATIPGLDTIATDPYWKLFGQPAREFVGGYAQQVRALADRNRLTPQIWIMGFRLGPEDADDIHAAVGAARQAGVEDLWVWGYEACGHMTYLDTSQPERVWTVLTDALIRADRPGAEG